MPSDLLRAYFTRRLLIRHEVPARAETGPRVDMQRQFLVNTVQVTATLVFGDRTMFRGSKIALRLRVFHIEHPQFPIIV